MFVPLIELATQNFFAFSKHAAYNKVFKIMEEIKTGNNIQRAAQATTMDPTQIFYQ